MSWASIGRTGTPFLSGGSARRELSSKLKASCARIAAVAADLFLPQSDKTYRPRHCEKPAVVRWAKLSPRFLRASPCPGRNLHAGRFVKDNFLPLRSREFATSSRQQCGCGLPSRPDYFSSPQV